MCYRTHQPYGYTEWNKPITGQIQYDSLIGSISKAVKLIISESINVIIWAVEIDSCCLVGEEFCWTKVKRKKF